LAFFHSNRVRTNCTTRLDASAISSAESAARRAMSRLRSSIFSFSAMAGQYHGTERQSSTER
jgi:hypothetical protein